MRVISTSPSITEILGALGIEPVAVSHACNYPPSVNSLPTIDVSKVDAVGSADRDRQTSAMANGGHLYELDAALINELNPDVIFTQGVCEVCAVDDVLVETTVKELEINPTMVSISARTLEDVFTCIQQVGEVTASESAAANLLQDVRTRISNIREASVPYKPRTVILEWMDPIRPAGNWVPEIVEIAGGDYVPIEIGERSRPYSWKSIVDIAPELFIISPCGYSIDQTRRQLSEVTERSGWDSLPAVQSGNTYIFDGSRYLNRWSPRLVDALESISAIILSEAEHPAANIEGIHHIPHEAS